MRISELIAIEINRWVLLFQTQLRLYCLRIANYDLIKYDRLMSFKLCYRATVFLKQALWVAIENFNMFAFLTS